MLKANKTILYEKLKESLSSVLPITAIVFVLCFTVVPVPTDILISFIIGAIMLILGMGLFTLGTDLAMTPIGSEVGSAITRSRKLWFIALISLVVGIIITIAEPDLQVLAEQVPNIPNMTIIITVAVGVGVFLVIAMLRIVFKIPLNYLLIGFYAAVFVVSIFVPKEFLAVAFDSGGVTTGPMTVPFIMALGVGAAAIRTDKNAEQDSFGLVALCSIGPIISVLVLGLIFKPTGADAAYSSNVLPVFEDTKALWNYFKDAIPYYFKEVVLALSPIIVFFVIFQLTSIKMKKDRLIRITIGLVYTFIGLVIFLTGVNVGFMPVGQIIGAGIADCGYAWLLIPIGMVIGYFIVAAEPAVHVLTKQVEEISNGFVTAKMMQTALSVGVCISVGIAMLRILTGISVLWFLIPGYVFALVLTRYVSPIFTGIAYDSGGVASGPMTATFLLPFAMGACEALGGNVMTDAFGIVAMVAMTPLITIQMMGFITQMKEKAKRRYIEVQMHQLEDDILYFD